MPRTTISIGRDSRAMERLIAVLKYDEGAESHTISPSARRKASQKFESRDISPPAPHSLSTCFLHNTTLATRLRACVDTPRFCIVGRLLTLLLDIKDIDDDAFSQVMFRSLLSPQ